jgi:predicted ATPase
VIGRSSSGKTTLINELKRRGYQTIEEVAREILTERAKYPVTKEEQETRQRMIYQNQLERENLLREDGFLDRGLVDCLAYTNYFGVDNSFIDKKLLRNRYFIVLELEKRPFIPDGIRIEKDEEEVNKIYSLVHDAYIRFGYTPFKIPNFCKERLENASLRADYILNELSKNLNKGDSNGKI